jgi:hypothetical protein
LKPALDLLLFGFKEFLVARHVKGSIESAVDRGGVLAHNLAEPGDIVLHFVLMRWRDGRRSQSLEDFGDQAKENLDIALISQRSHCRKMTSPRNFVQRKDLYYSCKYLS